MNNVVNYIFYFFFYSAVGWLCESIYCSVRPKKWINRGFLKGPVCPIYGTGALVMLIFLLPLTKLTDKLYFSIPLVFVVGMVLCDIVEFITSVIMEKLFHARWWDYSGKKFNIQGRICLTHTIYWGLASVIFIFLGHKYIGQFILELMPKPVRDTVVIAILAVFAIDLLNTVRSALDFRKFSLKLQSLSDSVAAYAEVAFSAVGSKVDSLQEKGVAAAKVLSADAKTQLEDMKKQFTTLRSPGKFRIITPRRYILRSFPYLERGVKNQLKLLEEIIDEIENKFTDDNEEKF